MLNQLKEMSFSTELFIHTFLVLRNQEMKAVPKPIEVNPMHHGKKTVLRGKKKYNGLQIDLLSEEHIFLFFEYIAFLKNVSQYILPKYLYFPAYISGKLYPFLEFHASVFW